MFRRIRLAVLLYILAFAAVGNYLAGVRSTDWNDTLWVDIYPINADDSLQTQAYIEGLRDEDFAEMEGFLAREAQRYGITLGAPFRIELAEQVTAPFPELPAASSPLETMLWSLKMRWYGARVRRASDRPSPDIQLFALYHDAGSTQMLDRSTALRRGLIAVAKVFASGGNARSNQVVMAHELLHTLGATDKYDPATNQPLFPQGYADPGAEPLLPQRKAELMAGRIPMTRTTAEIPADLGTTLIGPATAIEIRWLQLE